MTNDTDHPPAEAPAAEAPATATPGVSAPELSSPPNVAPPPADSPRVEGLKATAPPRVGPAVPTRSQVVGVALLNTLERLAKWVAASLMHPKVRLVVVGTALIILGAWIIDHSVWTFPLVVIGAIMIVVAWVGSRLEGRFGIEWNEGGAGFEMQARFKARVPALPAPAPTSTTTGPRTTVRTRNYSAEGADETVIEGEAHTIEIDVDELKALVEAAERGTMFSATANGAHVSWQGPNAGVERDVDGTGN